MPPNPDQSIFLFVSNRQHPKRKPYPDMISLTVGPKVERGQLALRFIRGAKGD